MLKNERGDPPALPFAALCATLALYTHAHIPRTLETMRRAHAMCPMAARPVPYLLIVSLSRSTAERAGAQPGASTRAASALSRRAPSAVRRRESQAKPCYRSLRIHGLDLGECGTKHGLLDLEILQGGGGGSGIARD